MITKYHAKYFAHKLTKKCSSDSIQKLMVSLADAQVDLKENIAICSYRFARNKEEYVHITDDGVFSTPLRKCFIIFYLNGILKKNRLILCL